MTFALLTAVFAAGPVTAGAAVDRADLRLSEQATLTLTIEGDAPLRVTPPPAWVPTDAPWRLRDLGPARVEDVPPARQRWTLRLRADPDVPGDLSLQVAPAQVTAGTDAAPRELPFPPAAVRVSTSVVLGRDGPRPPTDVEDPPPADAAPSVTPLAVAALAFGVAFLGVLLLRRRRSRRLAWTETPRNRFAREASDLGHAAIPDGEFAARLSSLVRSYVEAADGLPAPRRTPREIGPLTTGVVRLQTLPDLLQRCDAARFSGAALNAEARAELLAAALRLADGGVEGPAGGG